VVPRDLCGLGILIGAIYSEQSKDSDFVELKGAMKHLAKTVLERHTIIIIVTYEGLSSSSSVFAHHMFCSHPRFLLLLFGDLQFFLQTSIIDLFCTSSFRISLSFNAFY
jgi:hypothetical protein